MLKMFAVTVALMSAAFPAFAQDDVTPPMSPEAIAESRPLVDRFFNALKAGDVSQAYTDLFAGTLVSGKVLEVQNLISQSNFILTTYGPIKGWTLGRSDCFSPTLCRAIYQIDTDNGPIFVFLTLYRRSSGWMPVNIYFTDVSTNLFD